MKKQLTLTIGQYSSAGRKPLNQDFHGTYVPDQALLDTKGIVVALADGISTSDVSQYASQTAINSFIADYYCTSDAWSVKNSAQRVLKATNSWLYSQTLNSPYRFDINRGYVCTFSALIFKSNTAHLFHVGDCRVYQLSNGHLDQLSHDHRRQVSEDISYLTKGLGINHFLDIDYLSTPVTVGDFFILATDGVYEFINHQRLIDSIQNTDQDFDTLAKQLVEQAYQAGSDDNLTLQIVRVDEIPERNLFELQEQINSLPPAPKLEVGKHFEGYHILREVYLSSRSHVYLAEDQQTQQTVIIKTPSTEMRNNERYLEEFLMEEWIVKRLNNPHIVKTVNADKPKYFIYTVTEYLEGQTLAQWIIDNPSPSLDKTRDIITQIAKGLQAIHRQQMIHQDLRPNNIMIDSNGSIKIIDFGSTKIAGIQEFTQQPQEIAGTAQYSAPEYFLGADGSSQSDIFSLGVIAYQLLSGKLPYGNGVAKTNNSREQQRLRYQSLLINNDHLPGWIDFAVKKACEIKPEKRYQEVAEFVHEFTHPNQHYLSRARPPLIERNPVLFWQMTSLVLLLLLLYEHIH